MTKPTEDQMPRLPPIPLLICSIGNPGVRYRDTLHSAGHVVISDIASLLRYPAFSPSKGSEISSSDYQDWTIGSYGRYKKTENRREPDWTFWKSGKLMNESGPAVKSIWNEWRKSEEDRAKRGKLVILHDELEKELGKFSVREGSASAKGHNGIKSIQKSFAGSLDFTRIAIGIGRPESRDPRVVADFVLRKMTSFERGSMDKVSGPITQQLLSISGD